MVAPADTGFAVLRPAGPFPAVALISLAIVTVSLLTVGWRLTLTREWAGPELASSVTLGLLAVWLAGQGQGRFWPLPATAGLLCLRELDFQNWFFDPGLLRADLLTSAAPWWHKALGLAVALLIAITLIRLLWLGAGAFWRGLRDRAGWALVLGGAVLLLALVTQLDGLGGDLERSGHAVSAALRTALLVAEEAGELGFALALVLAADLGLRQRG